MLSRKQYWYSIMKYDGTRLNGKNKQNIPIIHVVGKERSVRFNNEVYVKLVPTRTEIAMVEAITTKVDDNDKYNETVYNVEKLPPVISKLDIDSIKSLKSSIKLPTIHKTPTTSSTPSTTSTPDTYCDNNNVLHTKTIREKVTREEATQNQVKKQQKQQKQSKPIFHFHDDILSYILK